MTQLDTENTSGRPAGAAQRDHTRSDLLGSLGRVPRPLIWFGLFGAPVAWFVQINLGLAFAALGCRTGNSVATTVLNVAVVLVTLAGLWVSLRLRAVHDQPDDLTGRVTHFLGRFGAWHTAVFVLLTGMTAVIAPFLAACPAR